MNDHSAATPRPWTIRRYTTGNAAIVMGPKHIASLRHSMYADAMLSNEANAALIVEAVNTYDAYKALEGLVVALLHEADCYSSAVELNHPDAVDGEEWEGRARAALAALEEARGTE